MKVILEVPSIHSTHRHTHTYLYPPFAGTRGPVTKFHRVFSLRNEAKKEKRFQAIQGVTWSDTGYQSSPDAQPSVMIVIAH